jgi:hypothetical protein
LGSKNTNPHIGKQIAKESDVLKYKIMIEI